MGATTEDAFCLKWNDFHTSVTTSFAELRNESDLLDATIICEGQALRAHKLVLSACSGVFRQLFRSAAVVPRSLIEPIVLLWDVKAEDLKLLFNFMYEGQVNVAQEHLNTFLALAERLQVRGLTSTNDPGVATRTAVVAAAAAAAAGSNSSNVRQQVSARRLRPVSPKRPRSTATAASVSSEDVDDDTDVDVKPDIKAEDINSSHHVYGGPVTASTVGAAANAFPGHQQQFNQFYEQPSHGAAAATTTTATANNTSDAGENEEAFGHGTIGEDFAMQPTIMDTGSKDEYEDSNNNQDDQEGTLQVNIETVSSHTDELMKITAKAGECPYCSKSFQHLRDHVENKHLRLPQQCPTCRVVFASKKKFASHKYRSNCIKEPRYRQHKQLKSINE